MPDSRPSFNRRATPTQETAFRGLGRPQGRDDSCFPLITAKRATTITLLCWVLQVQTARREGTHTLLAKYGPKQHVLAFLLMLEVATTFFFQSSPFALR